ncbi:hypothetical protein TCON_1348 [Astathelohania contejeani]|uniref:Uncharacterized protein n=1 Tax=Astathelohania contejeani TaxID=164912 RepID=A0ABQ7HZ06_9MICR|nr:hypothetical protein TCON_1348 [Thelohania contejeani]
MEGFTQSRASEHETKNSFKAEHAGEGIEPVKAISNQKSDQPPKSASRMTILKTILLSVDSTIESWLRDVFEAVQKRYGRMLRGAEKKLGIPFVRSSPVKLEKRNLSDGLT